MSTKVCSKCRADKPLDAFQQRSRMSARDGRYGICRECANAYARGRYAKRASQSGSDFETEERTDPGIPVFDDLAINENVPDSHLVKGVSTLVDGDGNIKARWIKTVADNTNVDAILDAVRELAVDLPRAEPVAAPELNDDDLLAVYPIGDAHFGMLAWGQECGEAFDLEIAERNLGRAVDHLTALAPPAHNALVINIGDFVHADGLGNTTTKGTRVDVDGRWPKIIRVSIRALRRTVDRCLERHQHVTLWNLRGNHDDLSAMVLAIALGQFYEHEPRVTVCQSPEMFKWYRFGANLIGATHGDKLKPQDMLGVMATDRAKDWGETKHRRFYCGHIHHEVVKELPGVTVEYLRTLAGSDAWHRGQGYRSGRDMRVDVLHRDWGLINRHIVGIEQIRRSA